jgi:uroporphyrinogen III methyltransferase/synthase
MSMSDALDGRSVVITRSAAQNASLRILLEAQGASVVEVPLIAIEEPEDEGRERDAMLQRFHSFDWVVVTSMNGAERVAPFITASFAAADAEKFPRFAAVGESTARALGVSADLVAEPARAAILAGMFPAGEGMLLLVQGNLAEDDLVVALTAKGWSVTKVVAYRTVSVSPAPEQRDAALSADVLLLASGSAAQAWVDAFGTSTPPVVVSIGPSTTKVAEQLGISVTATAAEQTLGAMISAAANSIGA